MPLFQRFLQLLCADVALALTIGLSLSGCATEPAGGDMNIPVSVRLVPLGRPDALLLGEQHDAASHQHMHLQAVQTLAQAGELAAVVLEMADAGKHTLQLRRDASEATIQQALAWREAAWPWAAYGPAIRAAVTAGIPVLGGNLPTRENAATMRDPTWDVRIPADALTQQRTAVRDGHCNLLPAGQIGPMARIQVARDASMADTIASAIRPGKTVLVLTGSAHAHRQQGIALHLPAGLRAVSVRLDASGPRPDDAAGFDAVWPTPPAPAKDHCAELQRQLRLTP